MAKPINPRRTVLACLAKLRRDARELQKLWDTKSTMMETYVMDDGRMNARDAPRPASEYPENQAAYWSHLHVKASALSNLSEELAAIALTEYRRTLAEGEAS